jgi:hypothetical protein
MPAKDLENLLGALVDYARLLATRLAGDPERQVPCHFCGAPMALWENLLVQQMAGVPAHVQCPLEALRAKLKEAGPIAEFPYDEFSQAVDLRLKRPRLDAMSGTIER